MNSVTLFDRVGGQETQMRHRCFPVEFVKFLETAVYERLLLKPVVSPGVSSH